MSAPQSISRPVRTLTQVATSGVLIEFVDAVLIDLSDRQYGASVALLTVVLSFAQVLVENFMGKAFLRRPSNAPAHEVVEP